MGICALGQIAFVQVAPRTLKVAGEPEGYDPAPLLQVKQLLINRRGALGIASDGAWVMDVHHADHPHTRNRKGGNGVSLGFTSHYTAMRIRFGPHIIEGCAGENIVIANDMQVTRDDLGTFLLIHHRETQQCFVLDTIQIAEPCLPFARFALGNGQHPSAALLKAGLQFLRWGMRGFYLLPIGTQVMVVEPGDDVYTTDAPTLADACSDARSLCLAQARNTVQPSLC